MNITIRRAVKEDCPRLMELVQELAVYEKAPEEVTVTLDHFMESGFGANPVWWAFVAIPHFTEADSPLSSEKEMDGKVVGFALYYIRYSTWKGQRMYLEDLLVNQPWRSRGIGKLLFDRLIEEAEEKKFSGMMWQVLEWNEPAINFYRKYSGVHFDNEWVNCSLPLQT